jgi:membrane protein DedA with SNARE-associated domain
VLWACVVGGVGWLSGQAAESVFGNIRYLEAWLFLGIVVVALVVWLVRKTVRK